MGDNAIPSEGMVLIVYVPHHFPIRDRIVPLLHVKLVPLVEPIAQQSHHRQADRLLPLNLLLLLLRLSFILPGDHRQYQHTELLNPVFLYLLNYLAPHQSHHLPSMFSNLYPCSISAIVGDALHPLPVLSVVDLALNP